MASPWKLLGRLVSIRRKQLQDGKTAGAKPDMLAIAGPTRGVAGDDPGQPAGIQPSHRGSSAAASAETRHPDADERKADNAWDIFAAHIATVSGLTPSSVIRNAISTAHAADGPAPAVKRTAHKKKRIKRKARSVEAISQVTPNFQTALDDKISLDEEIRLLRGQLASRLEMQNAQLRKMLERFER